MKAVRKTAESHVRKRLTVAIFLVIQLGTKCNLFHCYNKALYIIPVLGNDDASEDSGNGNKSPIGWERLRLEARSIGNGDGKMGRWFNGDR